jgi:hypothetical protein
MHRWIGKACQSDFSLTIVNLRQQKESLFFLCLRGDETGEIEVK